jgi:hypothetical protein
MYEEFNKAWVPYAILFTGLIYLSLTVTTYFLTKVRHSFIVKFLFVQIIRDILLCIVGFVLTLTDYKKQSSVRLL